jgi:hypothetical protein
MTLFVIYCDERGKFATPPGAKHSYTSNIAQARTFRTLESAMRECCQNEEAFPITVFLRNPEP